MSALTLVKLPDAVIFYIYHPTLFLNLTPAFTPSSQMFTVVDILFCIIDFFAHNASLRSQTSLSLFHPALPKLGVYIIHLNRTDFEKSNILHLTNSTQWRWTPTIDPDPLVIQVAHDITDDSMILSALLFILEKAEVPPLSPHPC